MLRGFGAYFFPIRHTALLYYADFSMSTSFVHFLGFSMDFVQFLQFLCRYQTDFIFFFTEFIPKSTFLSRISLKHSSLTFFHMPACDIIFLKMFLSYVHLVFSNTRQASLRIFSSNININRKQVFLCGHITKRFIRSILSASVGHRFRTTVSVFPGFANFWIGAVT